MGSAINHPRSISNERPTGDFAIWQPSSRLPTSLSSAMLPLIGESELPLRPVSFMWMGVFLAAFFWLFDSWVDSIFFTREPFVENLPPVGMDLYMRSVVTVMMLLFGIITSKYIDASNQLSRHLLRDTEVVRNEFKLLYENSPLAVIFLDPDLHVLDWNAGAEKLFGLNLRETRGWCVFDLIHPHEVSNKNTQLVDTCKQLGWLVGSNLSKDGNTTRRTWKFAPVHDPYGKVTKVVFMAPIL